MKLRFIDVNDVRDYEEDIAQCYMDNLQIMDSQTVIDFTNRDEMLDYIFSILESKESAIQGVFDNDDEYLYGLIIYDGIRLTDDGNAAQLHLATCKDMWGQEYLKVYQKALDETLFDTLYCMVPAICRPVISLLKKLGFKKTGYIPKALPYTNLKGKTKMYDEYVYVWRKKEYAKTS